MADSGDRSASSGSGVLLGTLTGVVIGAAGLAWWLLHEADRRRLHQRQQRLLRLSRFQAGVEQVPAASTDLHDRVQQLNQAIDDVRRQLEQLQTQP